MRKDCKYSSDELAEADELLREMRGNCIKKDTNTYDDPKRDAKYKALTIAIYAVSKIFWE